MKNKNSNIKPLADPEAIQPKGLPPIFLMAIVQNPIIGRARKQAGGMIFYKHYQKNVIRSRPIEVRPNNSPARMAQRGKFAAVKAFGSFLINYFRFAFMGDAIKMSAFSMYMHKNLPAGLNPTGPPYTINVDTVDFGGMSLPVLDELTVTGVNGRKLLLAWNNDSPAPAEDTDELAICIFDKNFEFTSYTNPAKNIIPATIVRSDAGATIQLDTHLGSLDKVDVLVLVYNPTKYHAGSEFCSKAMFFKDVNVVV